MPRTQINYPARTEQPPPDGSSGPNGRIMRDSAVHVTWLPGTRGDGGEGHVQVALEVDMAYAQVALDHPNGDAPATTYLYSPALGRSELNKMIRTLRQARDAAYGRDE